MEKPSHNRDRLPSYDPHDQGVADDLREVPYSSQVRNARSDRYRGTKDAIRATDSGELSTTDAVRDLLATTIEQRQRSRRSNNAVIYLRVSTEEQARVGGTAEGYSIPYQRDACLRKATDLGLTVVEEYVDAGHSAKSANRPQLQQMLRDLQEKSVGYVIVHKIDRLARNTRDDHQINDAIKAAGARLLSVVDLVDDSPQGRFNYTIQAGLAQLYSDNLAIEVLKGLSKKAQTGGTPYKAPIGYLNKRRFEGVADIRWIETDPDRAPLVRWAFEEYATGDWSLARLRLELIDRGLTNSTGKPISLNGLYKILTNPYYTGIVPFRGAYYEGTHEKLVDLGTWMSVQQILQAHNLAGEKEHVHAHYLKGTIWCGGCGSRLIFSRNKGKSGKYYDYFVCIGRHRKRNSCTRRAVQVSAIEQGIAKFYERFEIPRESVEEIQEVFIEEFSRLHQVAQTELARNKRRIQSAEDQRRKLLRAVYDEAIPQDLLKEEMQRLTTEIASAQTGIKQAETNLAELEEQFARAVAIVSRCVRLYEEAKSAIRRQINQGLFEKLYIDQDGHVEYADVQEPFRALVHLAGRELTWSSDSVVTLADTPSDVRDVPGRADAATGRSDVKTPGQILLTGCSNVDYMAEAEGFEPPDPCRSSAFKADAFGRSATLPCGQPIGDYGVGGDGGSGWGGSLTRSSVGAGWRPVGYTASSPDRFSEFVQLRGVAVVVSSGRGEHSGNRTARLGLPARSW